VGKLERYEESPFFNKTKPSAAFQLKLGSNLAKWWISQAPQERRETAEKFMEKQAIFEKLLKPNAEAIWLEAYLDLEKTSNLQGIAQKYSSVRNLTSLSSKNQEQQLDPFYLILGKTFRVLKEYDKSQEFLKKIATKDLISLRDLEELKVLVDQGKKRQSVDKGLKTLSGKKDRYHHEVLDLCRQAVIDGKVWDMSKRVLGAAKGAALSDSDMVPYFLMSGRALFEQAEYQKSIETYREILKGTPDLSAKAESHFQMGRSLINLKDLEGAKKEWNEVISMNDEFWSPLAKNELNLVESK
jgi:tetratricopeptide (TPR) repeat protein